MLSSMTMQEIIHRLGGLERLKQIGAANFVVDESRVSFTLGSNPKGVHSVVIDPQPHGRYRLECYGMIVPGTFKAPLIASANEVLADSLATVLGQFTGIDALHHRHF